MRDISLGHLTEFEKINQFLEHTYQDYTHIKTPNFCYDIVLGIINYINIEPVFGVTVYFSYIITQIKLFHF